MADQQAIQELAKTEKYKTRSDIFQQFFAPKQKELHDMVKKMDDDADIEIIKMDYKFWSIKNFAETIGCSRATLNRFLAENLREKGNFEMANLIAMHLGGQELFLEIVPDVAFRIRALKSGMTVDEVNTILFKNGFKLM